MPPQSNSSARSKRGLHAFVFWLTYLWIPFAVVCVWVIARRKGWARWLAVILFGLSLPVAWARFVEPQLLFVHHEEIDLSDGQDETFELRIALFSDPHIGVFKNAIPLSRLIDRVNQETVDAVFIAGDFLYHLPFDEIETAMAAVEDAEAPVFAVLGNHDLGFPGPPYIERLRGPLRRSGVTFVENRAFEEVLGGHRIVVAGASDYWQRRFTFAFKANLPEGVPVLLLTHNPDIALKVPNDFDYDLMLAGHTHGGQIRLPIPGLTRMVIPTKHPFDTGLHTLVRAGRDEPDRIYVTPGTGMIGLPMRFRRPPRIDILTLTLPTQG